MRDYTEALASLKTLLGRHESVISFREAKEKIEQLPDLTAEVVKMKAYQQEAVLLDKVSKPQAAASKTELSQRLQENLDDLPIVQDFRCQMQDASDLLHYVTSQIEDKINEELTHGK